MTLIECFTGAHIDNIAACLRLEPEKMVMIGNAAEMEKPVKRYRKLLEKRGLSTRIYDRDVENMDIGQISRVLQEQLEETEDCVIDLTGGDESVIMAVGAVIAGLKSEMQRRIRVEKFDHTTGQVLDCLHQNRQIAVKPISLTVEELITLHGGVLSCDTDKVSTKDDRGTLEDLWTVASGDTKTWNKAVAYLREFESRADSLMQVFLPLRQIASGIGDFETKEKIVRELLEKLRGVKVIEDHSTATALEYTYRSGMLRYCLNGPGNVLEVKTFLEGWDVRENGKSYFSDWQTSVDIDWDGVVHTPGEKTPDTRNEIDVILMRGTVPLFISCKNGTVNEDELYKLHTVAERFGGPYAKKMLIVTDLEKKNPEASKALAQRARDMGVLPVMCAAELTAKDWAEKFKEAMK